MDKALPQENVSGSVQKTVLLVFLLALAMRLLFLFATPDAGGSFSPYYKGDTPYWLEHAGAIQLSEKYDHGLPMRPPGIAYLVSWLWNGQSDGLLLLKLSWSIMGALTVALLFLALLRSFGQGAALVAAVFCAVSTGLMIVSTSINNETPYLLLVIASFLFWEPLKRSPGPKVLIPWAILGGLACLIRAEHVLFLFLVSIYLLYSWSRALGWKSGIGSTLLAWVVFGLTISPWQLHSWAEIEKFNQQPLALDRTTEQAYLQLEQALSELDWADEAIAGLESLPAFSQRPMKSFVASTVAVRGNTEVSAEDIHIIDQAFGSRPEPIGPYPFITLYGALNFYLANNPGATGGFSQAPLELPPPLAGGASLYPAFLVNGLPPPELTFSYPPHVEIVNHGYRLGWDWIQENPGDALSLGMHKIGRFWSGVALGMGGYNLPLGMSGTRQAVDLVVPDNSIGVWLWRWTLLAILLAGLWAGRRQAALIPWLALLATKLIATLGFFGYAREGVVVIPVFAVLLGLLASRVLTISRDRAFRPGQPILIFATLAVLLLAIESYRWNAGHIVTLDGFETGADDPFPVKDFEKRRLEVRSQ